MAIEEPGELGWLSGEPSRIKLFETVPPNEITGARSGTNLHDPVEDEIPQPYRGIDIATLPGDLRRQLKPHFSHWMVTSPDSLRDQRADHRHQFFAQTRKGWKPVPSLQRLEFGQRVYAFRRLPLSEGGGGDAAGSNLDTSPSAPALFPAPSPSVTILSLSHPGETITQKDPEHFIGEELLVSGNVCDAASVTLNWTGKSSGGPVYAQLKQSELWSDPSYSDWKALLPGFEPGKYTLTAMAGSALDKVDVRIEKKPMPELVIGVFFDGTGNNMFADPPGEHTNIAKLRQLYDSPTSPSIYIQGVGTMAKTGPNGQQEKDLSELGLAMGLGPYGAATRLSDAKEQVLKLLTNYEQSLGAPPEVVTFDIFGFSRGAMLARHFVNMIHAGLPDLDEAPQEGEPRIFPDLRSVSDNSIPDPLPGDEPPPNPFLTHMYPRLAADVQVRFLGIFDSVGSFYWPGDDDEGFINANLTPGSAGFVYHPTARDEIRENFPLTCINSADGSSPSHFLEEEFFGAHSDVGGGYDSSGERIFLTEDTYWPKERGTESGEPDLEWKNEMEKKKRSLEKDLGITCQLDIMYNSAYFFELRPTKPGLSLVALQSMHQQAQKHGVPFKKIKVQDTVPEILNKLVARSRAGDPSALKQLDEEYIHTSHRHFLPAYFKETVGIGAEKDGKRDCFPNCPQKAITPAKQTVRST